jgi:hypothetical protein
MNGIKTVRKAAGAAEAAAVLAGGKFSGWQWRSPRYS